MIMNIFVFAASARTESLNRKLASVVASFLEESGHSVNCTHLGEYDLPLYHGDWEKENGVPEAARLLKTHMAESQATIIVSPEYNGSIPGVFKNAIDWMSRPDKAYTGENPFVDKSVLLISASPGYFGGIRMQNHLRDVLSQLGANVFGRALAVPKASSLFDADGILIDESMQGKIDKLLTAFLAN